MTVQELCDHFDRIGWVRFNDPTNQKSICYEAPRDQRLRTRYDCEYNWKQPPLIVSIHPTSAWTPPRVTFRTFGERGGHWCDYDIYNIELDEAVGMIPKARLALTNAWNAFAEAMNET